MKKVSFVCTTYRRFYCVRRIITQYLKQTYEGDIELIIYNTDDEYPFVLDDSLNEFDIKVFNNNIDYETKLPYTNRGSILRDATSHATGDYFMLADDDDVYLPWHIKQAVENIEIHDNKDAWKPIKSFFKLSNKLELVDNNLEASIIVKMNRIKELGFKLHSGAENLSWLEKIKKENKLYIEYKNYIPSYCFNWGDPPEIAGHKQSGFIDDPNNFENHKLNSNDISNDKLTMLSEKDIIDFYKPFYEFILNNKNYNLLSYKYINDIF